jgi:ATP-dependent Clp protease ATP-binding subunit ClpA
MNFIKILSVQFVKFCNNIYFSPDNINPNNREIIENARKVVIKNFILLTKVFACSPYDNILLGQAESLKFMYKSNKLNIKENVLLSLAKDKKEIFSFEKIKPSLVFFNKDGQSLSIISNCNKSDKEYQDLKALWNSQNYGNNNNSDLTDYKSLSHDEFLKEIKNLFSLDKMSIDELKLLCESSGHYIFVSDNYIKMVRILLNIEAKIPTILMGETGVGKTKLMEILSTLYGNGKSKWKILQIHAGITDQDIVNMEYTA